jgi:hypothetical protein
MSAVDDKRKSSGEMYARAVDDAATRLRDLRREEREDFVLGALALGLALAATSIWPVFAFALFVGGMAVVIGGMRAAWRRWDLVDRLASDLDAYAIPEVQAHAARQATM